MGGTSGLPGGTSPSAFSLLREAYDPKFRGQMAKKDMVVYYPYKELGCPLLVYYDTPWKPVVEL